MNDCFFAKGADRYRTPPRECECDNGLQEGGGGESRKGTATASSVVDGLRGLEGGAVDAFVAGKRTGVFAARPPI
jgi:hypothetical protein